jgi:hypothetical protein
MIGNSCRFLKVTVLAAAVLAGLMSASCDAQYSSPQQVRTSNPSVTYRYYSDQELVQANQSAAAFCNQYQSVPRTANFTDDWDGSKVVVFECVQTTMAAAPRQQFNPNLTYNYRTDQELLDASRNAQNYCRNNGSQEEAISNIVTNANGTKTATFQCSPE